MASMATHNTPASEVLQDQSLYADCWVYVGGEDVHSYNCNKDKKTAGPHMFINKETVVTISGVV